MDLLVLSRVETTTRTWAIWPGVSSYLSRPPVPLLGKELLRFPVCGAEVAVAVAADDGTVGEDNRHGADTFTNHCFFWKESRWISWPNSCIFHFKYDFIRDDMRKFLIDALLKLSRTNLRDPRYVGVDLIQRFWSKFSLSSTNEEHIFKILKPLFRPNLS